MGVTEAMDDGKKKNRLQQLRREAIQKSIDARAAAQEQRRRQHFQDQLAQARAQQLPAIPENIRCFYLWNGSAEIIKFYDTTVTDDMINNVITVYKTQDEIRQTAAEHLNSAAVTAISTIFIRESNMDKKMKSLFYFLMPSQAPAGEVGSGVQGFRAGHLRPSGNLFRLRI